MASRGPHSQATVRTRFSTIFSSPKVLTMHNDTSLDQSKPSRARSIRGTTSVGDPSAPSTPAQNNKSDRSYRLSLSKARKLSRVFSDFSFPDSFTPRKSVGDLTVQNRTSQRPSTSPGRAQNTPFEGHYHYIQSLDRKPSQAMPLPPSPIPLSPITPSSITIFPTPRSSAERIPQCYGLPTNIPTTSHNKSTSRPEEIPLPPSRPGSSRGGTSLLRKNRKSLELRPLDEFGFKVPLPTRSKSFRVLRAPELSRPILAKVPNLDGGSVPPPDTRAPPRAAPHPYVEVKRARKMTQLFGQELPQELIRVLDERRNTERIRPRVESTTSSLLDSDPTSTALAPEYEIEVDPVEGEKTVPSPPPEAPHIEFQERRKRVTKLSQFFGVNHAEIASSLVFTKPSGNLSASLDDTIHSPMSLSYGEPVEVGVKVVSRRRWGFGEDMRDVELTDAINKLRSLKAS